MTTDTSKAAAADTNTNTLSPEPPELNADRFLGISTKDGEPVAPPAAAKDTNGKSAAKTPPKVVEKDGEKDGEKDEGDGETKPHRSADKRIGQAVARQRAAERRADIAEAEIRSTNARLAALEAKTNSTVVDKTKTGATSGSEAPVPTNYEYGELDSRYIKDLARFEARQEFAENTARSNSAADTAKAQNAAKERAATIEAWSAKAPAELDDFDEVVIQGAKDGLWPLSETIGTLVLESDVGHQIAYALATDPKEAVRVSKLSAARQAIWFGQQEALLTVDAESPGSATDDTTKTPKVTKAPAPTSQRAKGSGSSAPVGPDTNDFAAFERLAQQGTK